MAFRGNLRYREGMVPFVNVTMKANRAMRGKKLRILKKVKK